jgi:hypothetical protein
MSLMKFDFNMLCNSEDVDEVLKSIDGIIIVQMKCSYILGLIWNHPFQVGRSYSLHEGRGQSIMKEVVNS